MDTITAIVEEVVRKGTTQNGNPRMWVRVLTSTQGYRNRETFKVRENSSLSLMIENAEYRETPHVFELSGRNSLSRDLGVWEG